MQSETNLSSWRLGVPPTRELGKICRPRKMAAINEAKSWAKGPDQESRIYHTIYSREGIGIALGKPGKEAAPDYNRCRYTDGRTGNNPNDMIPTVLIDGDPQEGAMSFDAIFESMHEVSKKDEDCLELMGCLFFRSAYLLDHVERTPDSWRLSQSEGALQYIGGIVPSIGGLPARAFLNLIEAIALNEDVKYDTLGYDVGLGYGRRNNLLTYCHLIGVLLERTSFLKFVSSFARPPPGVAPISVKGALEVFPPLMNGCQTNL